MNFKITLPNGVEFIRENLHQVEVYYQDGKTRVWYEKNAESGQRREHQLVTLKPGDKLVVKED